jgi:hypothetical protein
MMTDRDTPKAFTRLLRLRDGHRPRSGLDDPITGAATTAKGRKRKRAAVTGDGAGSSNGQHNGSGDRTAAAQQQEERPAAVDGKCGAAAEELRIQPGERLADFAARVDRALPLGRWGAGAAKSPSSRAGAAAGVPAEPLTRHAKRLRKMQAAWRVEEARLREREEEAREEAEGEWEERVAELGGGGGDAALLDEFRRAGGGAGAAGLAAGRARKRRKARDEEDPWAVLKGRRDEVKGLHDVAKEPPRFEMKPRKVLGAKVVDVPRAAGSLSRREALGEARQEIIQRYRRLMAERRGQ